MSSKNSRLHVLARPRRPAGWESYNWRKGAEPALETAGTSRKAHAQGRRTRCRTPGAAALSVGCDRGDRASTDKLGRYRGVIAGL